MSKAMEKLREAWEENPVMVIGVAAGAMMAAARLIDALGSIQSKRAYARRMDRRPASYISYPRKRSR